MLNSSISAERVAGRYQLIQRVGGGNMSSVYEAQDTRRGNRTVAVKLLNTEHDDALKQEIFRREIARGTRSLGSTSEPTSRGVNDADTELQGHQNISKRRAARVMEVYS